MKKAAGSLLGALGALAAAAAFATASAHAGEWGVNVYGLSYHWDRDVAKQNDWDNEFNPGLGVRYEAGRWLAGDGFVDAGAYRDSGRNTAVYTAAGLLWPLDRNKRFNLGVALTAFHSDTYNQGKAFVAPVPLFALRFPAVTLNFTHFPKIDDFNAVHTTAMFVTIPLR